ncbi:MAG: hypothetical protein KatS3mg102_1641 [Planctomycetota bacterium]|nr:MAG: hypothetical protein KatS3mg102_1641 [Planctomycetota bacterium]
MSPPLARTRAGLALGLLALALTAAPALAGRGPTLSSLQRELQPALAAKDMGAAEQVLVQIAAVDDDKALKLILGLALKAEEAELFEACRRALAQLQGPQAIAEAAKLLANPRGPFEPRVLVAEAFGSVQGEPVVPALVAALQSDPDATVRREAAAALGRKRDRRALQALCEAYAAEEADKGRLF